MYPLEEIGATSDIIADFLWEHAYAKHLPEKRLDELFRTGAK